jgi:hypothetical protein
MKMVWPCAALVALCLVPAARAADTDKPKARPKSFEVPYQLTIPKHIMVRAKINGKGPFNFILDTGAPALFVAVSVGKKVGVKTEGRKLSTFDRFEIEGGVVLEKVRGRVETPFQLEGMNGMGLAGVEVHGLIGYNILARYRIQIDFTRDKMIWTPLDHKPPEPMGMRGPGGGQGGLEFFGSAMKMVGAFLGKKANPDVRLRGFLGVTLADGEDNPVVKGVLESGPAGKAGLKVGDIITHFRGRGVTNTEDVARFVRRLEPGTKIKLTVLRGKATREITFTIGEGL